MEKFLLVKDTFRNIQRFNLRGRLLEFKLKPVPTGAEPVGWVKDAIDQVVQKAITGLHPQDQIGFSFCSKDFQRGDGWIRFQEAANVTTDDIWNVVSNIYQSNSTGLNTETFCLGVTSVRMPRGTGNDRGRSYNTFEEECAKRRGIVAIKNKDNLCLPRAIVVAIAYTDKDPNFTKIRDTEKLQVQKTLHLMEEAGVVISMDGAGIPELQLFQRHLIDYRITVYKYGTKGRDVIFTGGEGAKKLNLLYHEEHYNVITSLTAAFCCSYYCEKCHIPYDHKNKHRCGSMCPGCYQSPACPQYVKIKCKECQRSFRGQQCYDNHKKYKSMEKSTVCAKIKRCNECFKIVKADRKHTCGEVFCKICNSHVPQGHLCFIQPDKSTPKTKDILFVFYDLETRQEKISENGSRIHEPGLCIFNQCCDECMVTEQIVCKKCGVRQQVLKCHDPIAPFMFHLLTLRKKFKQVVVIAHNGQAYDHQFVLNYILTQTDLKPELIMNGTKIVLMTIANIKFLDSLNYFPMALNKLPKAFGLGESFKKGYFPHMFNIQENENYVGPLPGLEYYDPDNMKEGERTTFLKWYEEHKNDIFDMQRDIIDYCKADVDILTLSCLKFRQQLLSVGNVCPFTEACTIASACSKVFRRNFLKPNTIGIVPKNGYRWSDKQSKIAIQWLVWEEKQRGKTIVHAANGKEVVRNGVKVDGFCPDTGEIFEFHGCYFHGCPICFKCNRDDALHDAPSETMNYRYESTVSKSERLREFGYTMIEMWECQFIQQLAANKEMHVYTDNHPLLQNMPLNPRDAFYGGRTGNTRSYYKAGTGERVIYLDVCSLYPWVSKYGAFPLGHPQVLVGDECHDIERKNGLVKCKILPPMDLYHPVLPTKMNGKLMFVLCRTCGETMNSGDCAHPEEERALTGTWVIDEVKKALEKGYTMLEIYEVWHYREMEQFDKVNKSGGLFTEIMNKFIKVKQQASDWPGDCVTDEQKNNYIENFFVMEDVRLNFADVVENPGLRSLAKLILNSFWGKFGQRQNQPKTKVISDPGEFFGLLSNPAVTVNAVLPINENTLVINYEFIEEAADQLPVVNVCIASYVTAQARLKLYSYLEQLGDRVLYYDTDSVVYVSRPGNFDIPTGKFIGDMTDELEAYGAGSYITEFVSGGPKNYSYKVWSTKSQTEEVVCKVKGICLTYAASQLVNFDTIKDMVIKESAPVRIISRNIRRTAEHQVITKEETKTYKANSTKRIFSPDGNSVPYGYKRQKHAHVS